MSAITDGVEWQMRAACRGPQSVVFFPPTVAEAKDERSERERRAKAICAVFRDAGVPAEAQDDIAVTLWTKFLFITTMAGTTSLAREYLRDLLPRPEWHKIIVGCMTEIEAAGRGSGVDLSPTIVADTLDYMESAKGAMSASMHADLLAGRPMELEALNGAVVRAGESAGVATPINDVIYAALKPYAQGAA